MHEQLNGLAQSLDIDALGEQIDELNKKTEDPEFWNDQNSAQ